jgi:hypothetical protein
VGYRYLNHKTCADAGCHWHSVKPVGTDAGLPRVHPCSALETGYIWGSNQVFLRLKPGISGLKPCIAETETRYFWGSNQVLLRLKLGISGAQTRHF